MESVNLNLVIAISLIVLVVFTICLFIILIPIGLQISKTLNSIQRLLNTINDFEPSVKKIKQNITNVTDAVEGAKIFVTSSIWGILSGLREYFTNKESSKKDETSYNNKGNVEKVEKVEK